MKGSNPNVNMPHNYSPQNIVREGVKEGKISTPYGLTYLALTSFGLMTKKAPPQTPRVVD